MPTLIMENSPKFITCPDCGERYDNARKRRLIDTCGHPRCYSCLFVDKPCPLCEKLPKERPKTDSNSKASSNENLDKAQRVTNLKKERSYVGSHPDLSELHKIRSATLPHSFRQDSYFRSLYRNEPSGSSENLSVRSSSPTPGGRPRSMPPSYHVSIENLNDQFWKSVEVAERKIGPKRKKGKDAQPSDSKETAVNTSITEVVECPAPDMVRLPVPSVTHPRSQLEHHLSGINEEQERRPRSLSDLNKPRCYKNVASESTSGGLRPLSWSPIQSPLGSRPSSVASRESTSSPVSPFNSRSTPKSDRFSDSSASICLSDTWSESSDSDSIQSPIEEKSNYSNAGQSPRKYTGNPLANVTYWVVEASNSVEVHKGYKEMELNSSSSLRHQSAKVTHAHHWNGRRAPNVPIVSLQSDVSGSL